MQTINLDLSVRSIIPLLHAKQGDVGRKFKVVLTDNLVAYPVPMGVAVSVWYSGPSGQGNYTDIGADSAISVSGNEITVELITQMLANAGEGRVCLAINTADGDQIGTWNIRYVVEPLPGMGSAAAQQYFTAFSQAVENLPYPDASLSAPGKAADAAAVGAALAGKAPAGYADNGHDTVVAQGTSGGWTYRKWASGIAECWSSDNEVDGIDIPAGSYATTTITLPFNFIDAYQTYQISLNGISPGYSLTAGTPWKAQGSAIVRIINNGASVANGVTFDLHITGRWK